jgi:galactokinase
MKDIENLLKEEFRKRFRSTAEAVAWAPGRVNIIGEHIDYSGGRVLPIAIGKRIYAAGRRSGGDKITLCSDAFDGEISFHASSIEPGGDWGDFPKGVTRELIRRGFQLGGFNAIFSSDLPVGAGVSSSAAMEIVVCRLLGKLFGFSIEAEEAALLSQKADHEFVGTRSGIMDQFVSATATKGNALFLDCNTLEREHIPLKLGDYTLVACDSGVKRELAASQYNNRRAECERGLEIIQRRFDGVRALCDATPDELEACMGVMPEPVYHRCRHAIGENARVLAAVEAMRLGDLEGLGRLMNESHDSLRDNYEVSCAELDLLVDAARGADGTLGSRLTGAGFGGSTISLVRRSTMDNFEGIVSEAYHGAFGKVPRIFECNPSDGAFREDEA